MVETELKFQLAETRKRAVLQRLKRAKAQTIHLQAKYYDTPDHVLAKHGIAIRLRQEGEHWVQTFKATGNSHLQRIEEEILLGNCTQEPELDLKLYKNNKTVQHLLNQVLKSDKNALQLQFQTQVTRYFYLETINDSSIEICLDVGEISTAQNHSIICEMEFELKTGSVEHLVQATKYWVKQYGLWLDVRSKSERGNLLATDKITSPASRAKTLTFSSNLNPEQVLQQIVGNCLEQLLPNSAVIAAGIATAEHIHQARIAIRRLRSALKQFGTWSTQIDPNWQAQLTDIFRQLGTTRDADVIISEVIPQLSDMGAPELNVVLSSEQQPNLDTLFSQTKTVNLLLDLLAFSHANTSKIQHKNKSKQDVLKHKIAKRLQHLHRQVIDDAKQFSKLNIDARHKTRKRVKQLRYLIEFVSSVYNKKQVKKYLKQLQPVQEHLGAYNDMIIAQEFFETQIEHNVHFWFALGWSKAHQAYLLTQAEQILKDFSSTKSFW